MRYLIAFIFCIVTSPLFAQDASLVQKREFVRQYLLNTISDPDVLANAELRLSRITTAEQLDALYAEARQAAYQREAMRLQQAIAYRNYLQQQLAYQRMYNRGPVGYAPVITWLPSGTSLGVGAVVSPDRRYVRITANPFFSSVGPVHTFTFQHGGHGYHRHR